MVCKTIKEKKGFKERKSTVFKKAKELSTLCDVDLLLIFYEADQPNVPQFWCSKPNAPNELITRYYGEKGAKKTELNHHYHNKVKRSYNNEFIKDLGIEDLKKLAVILEGKIQSVNDRINFTKEAAIVGFESYYNGNSQFTESLNFGNFGYDGRVEDVDERVNQREDAEYDGMWDSLLYDESFNLDDVVVNSGNVGETVNQIEVEGYNGQINGMNSTVLSEDRMMLDMGLQHLDDSHHMPLIDYDECFNFDDDVFGGYNCSNTAQLQVVNSGNVADCHSLLDFHVDDDLHKILMQFDVDDFSLDDLEF